jgi:hypothetical protein
MTSCPNCGTQLPDGAAFCYKCGSSIAPGGGAQAYQQSAQGPSVQQRSGPVIAPAGATALKCPSCGAPIAPKFGEMVITCEYCGTGIALGNEGWKDIQKHTMLPMTITRDQVESKITAMMDKGFFRHHLHEQSTLEEMNATFVPYWIIPVSARTSIVAVDAMQQVGQIATTAALMGVMGGMGRGGFGGGGGIRRRSFDMSSLLGPSLASIAGDWRRSIGGRGAFAGGLPRTMFYGMGMGMGGGGTKTYQLDQNYNFPVVAMKDLTEYQPQDYTFAMDQRVLFDVSKIDRSVKVLNGDISEDVAQTQAKTLVDQLQSQKAHEQHHMIQQLHTDMDVAEGELLHVPVWFTRYDHKGNKIVFVLDGNTGAPINSIGL